MLAEGFRNWISIRILLDKIVAEESLFRERDLFDRVVDNGCKLSKRDTVSAEYVHVWLESLSSPQAARHFMEKVFPVLDKGEDGCLERARLLVGLFAIMTESKCSPPPCPALHKAIRQLAFVHYDDSSSGKLNRRQWDAFVRDCLIAPTRSEELVSGVNRCIVGVANCLEFEEENEFVVPGRQTKRRGAAWAEDFWQERGNFIFYDDFYEAIERGMFKEPEGFLHSDELRASLQLWIKEQLSRENVEPLEAMLKIARGVSSLAGSVFNSLKANIGPVFAEYPTGSGTESARVSKILDEEKQSPNGTLSRFLALRNFDMPQMEALVTTAVPEAEFDEGGNCVSESFFPRNSTTSSYAATEEAFDIDTTGILSCTASPRALSGDAAGLNGRNAHPPPICDAELASLLASATQEDRQETARTENSETLKVPSELDANSGCALSAAARKTLGGPSTTAGTLNKPQGQPQGKSQSKTHNEDLSEMAYEIMDYFMSGTLASKLPLMELSRFVESSALLQHQSPLIQVRRLDPQKPVVFVGELLGSWQRTKKYFSKILSKSGAGRWTVNGNATVVVGGDYLAHPNARQSDEYGHSAEIVFFLLACRITHGDAFIFVRGLNELAAKNENFKRSCIRLFGLENGQDKWNDLSDILEFTPVSFAVPGCLFLHGGFVTSELADNASLLPALPVRLYFGADEEIDEEMRKEGEENAISEIVLSSFAVDRTDEVAITKLCETYSFKLVIHRQFASLGYCPGKSQWFETAKLEWNGSLKEPQFVAMRGGSAERLYPPDTPGSTLEAQSTGDEIYSSATEIQEIVNRFDACRQDF